MLAGVGQRLLGDAVDGVLQNLGEPVEGDPADELDLRAVGLSLVVDQMGDGGRDPRFVEDRRSHAADQPPGLGMGLPQHLTPAS